MVNPTTAFSPLGIRRAFGRDVLCAPREFGPAGWLLDGVDPSGPRVIASQSDVPGDPDGVEWIHASISYPDRMPTYDDLTRLHRGVFGDRWAYQVFAPASDHVNIHQFALHLWGRADGVPALPDFAMGGVSI